MKKLLTIVSCCLIVIFCFVGCSASKKQVDQILKNQIEFATNYEQDLILTTDFFSENLKNEYSSYYSETSIENLETLIHTSNISISRLKSYLQLENFIKNLDKEDAKEINKLNDNYYEDFEELVVVKKNLEAVITKGGQNTKKDYEFLNRTIYETINSSNRASNKLIKFIKENLSTTITNEQIEIGSGVLELSLLDTLNNALTFYADIYLNESNFENFVTYESQIANPSSTLNTILTTLNSCASAKFDLNSTNFVSLKNSIIILQTHNNELISEQNIFDKVIKDFDYETFKSNFEKSQPNSQFNSANLKIFVDSDNLDVETKTNYKYLSTTIYGKLNPTILTLKGIIESISLL